ncbi:hypothetical protein NDU88_000417, partial [Pleurodeles waltl]
RPSCTNTKTEGRRRARGDGNRGAEEESQQRVTAAGNTGRPAAESRAEGERALPGRRPLSISPGPKGGARPRRRPRPPTPSRRPPRFGESRPLWIAAGARLLQNHSCQLGQSGLPAA